ncbi:hypothetical protein ACJX0J_041476, partial [Zea mays]
ASLFFPAYTFLFLFPCVLNAYNLFEVRVSGDGNCQVHQLMPILFHIKLPETVSNVRADELKECNFLYEGYVPMKYKHYCKKMK